MHHSLTITLHFDESQVALILSKTQQLSEFLEASGIKVSIAADQQTIEWLDQQKPVTTVEFTDSDDDYYGNEPNDFGIGARG